ncbi:MAG: FtsX-like permease family protein [Magnetococcales bacterium]|nr:FtsX-like permease family protein [Magnetococcales bacterium]NGZ04890.1 FtsX-like permease family protein [Magnetococcales bacterium]
MKAIWVIAWRGIRGAYRDFLAFGWAVLLTVATTAGVVATAHALRIGVDQESRAMLAADVRLESMHPFTDQMRAFLHQPGWRVAENLEFTAMVRADDPERVVLVEVLAAAPEHPVRGELLLASGKPLSVALHEDGAVVESGVLERLGSSAHPVLQLGQARVRVTDRLLKEPDRVVRFFRWGPRLIISRARALETGLLGFGSRVQHVALVRLPEEEKLSTVVRQLEQLAAGSSVRVVTPAESLMASRRFIDRFAIFLHLMTLLTLLTGGYAMAGAMAAHARENRNQLAILRSLGAAHRTVMGIFLLRVLMVAAPASVGGAGIGILFPLLLGVWPVDWPRMALWPIALSGVGFGVLVALISSFGAFWSTRSVQPGMLFRSVEWDGGLEWIHWKWRWGVPIGMTGLAAGLLGWQAGWKGGGLLAVGVLCSFALLALVARGAVALLHLWQPSHPVWRQAVRSVTARGAGTMGSLVSVGLGVGVLCAVLFVEYNLDRQLVSRLPGRVPGLFLIDVQPDQEQPLQQLAARFPVDALRLTPVVRGRLKGIKGMPVTPEWLQSHPQAWRFQREYVLTWAQEVPVGNRVIRGQWWSRPQALEASVEREMAQALNLQLGDTLTFDILGTEIQVPVTSIRDLRWSDMGLNFFVIFSPAVLAGAPYSNLATLVIAPEQEESLRAVLVTHFPNVSVISARQVLLQARMLLEQLIGAIRLAGGLAMVAGLTALAVSVTLMRRRRVRDAAIRRLLGATRQDLTRVAWAESWLIGGIATFAGLLVGHGVTSGVITVLFDDSREWLPVATVGIWLGGSVLVAAIGYAATRRDLDQPILRALHTSV